MESLQGTTKIGSEYGEVRQFYCLQVHRAVLASAPLLNSAFVPRALWSSE